jgi:Flp pilus assembly protein TadD
MAWIDAEEDKNLDVALGRAQKAKSLMPESPSITDTLAWVLYKKGNYAGAATLLQECVQKSPDTAEFRYHLGMTLMATGQKPEGREQLETALRLRLGGSEAHQAQQALGRAD